jgi:hypothetical protein
MATKKTEIQYADLTGADIIVDKNGNEWAVTDVDTKADSEQSVTFWLTEKGVKMHRLSKPPNDTVTVLREPTRAEDIEQREAEVDAAEAPTSEPATEAEAVAAVEAIGGAVVAEETADHEAARNLARASGEPMSLPPFEKMTDPEKRSHIFLLHGVFSHDVKTAKALGKMHDELHQNETGKSTAHNHEGAFNA